MDESATRVTVAALRDFVLAALRSVEMRDADASVVADALVETDAMGVFTHGTKLLRDYVRRARAGGVRVDASPRVVCEGPAWAVVDGEAAMGQVVGAFAMERAVEKARAAGIAYVGVRNTNHIGAAGYYAWQAAKQGLIGVTMGNDIPSVAAPGSRRAVLGSNPLAYAIPTGRDPILLDMATSTVAGGKVYAAHQRGEPIPDTWIIGPDGRPTTDGSLYPAQAALAPMAGHKGYGISLLIETLAGVLSGAAVTWQVGNWIWGEASEPTHHGAAFIAIDVGAILPAAEFRARIDGLADELRSSPAAAGSDGVLLPGEREWRRRRAAQEQGIRLPADVVAKLRLLAEESGLTVAWL